MPELKWRLFIAQDNFMYPKKLNNTEGYFTVTWDKSDLKLSEHFPITIHYEQITHLTMLNDYKRI